MPRPQKTDSILEGVEKAAAALAGFDYNVDAEDFVLYELHRLIEEDRASFDDSEFRTLIDHGVRAHIAEKPEVRAALAGILRSAATEHSRTVTLRVVRALENIHTDLSNVGVVVRSYTAYLLSRLETVQEGEGDDRAAEAADLLFESGGDRDTAETALAVLCAAPSPVCARVLAHAVSEPLLDEDLEAKAFAALKTCWPLPRHYMLYNLQGHPHEDIPFRWFQLFVEVDELTTVDLVLEELRAHGESADYREDLSAILGLLHGCRDPELEDKILGMLNSPSASPPVSALLSGFLEEHQPTAVNGETPWSRSEKQFDLNRRYVEAARLFDAGQVKEAREKLDRILDEDPAYPFAVMLKGTKLPS
jgi:hypothetical protein